MPEDQGGPGVSVVLAGLNQPDRHVRRASVYGGPSVERHASSLWEVVAEFVVAIEAEERDRCD